jgi:hypothetical protein
MNALTSLSDAVSFFARETTLYSAASFLFDEYQFLALLNAPGFSGWRASLASILSILSFALLKIFALQRYVSGTPP